MATYAQRFLLVEDGVFRNRINFAMWITSLAILSEPTATPNHAKRVIWANNQLKGEADSSAMYPIALRVSAAVGPTGAETTDAQIQAVVDQLVLELVV